VPIPMTDDLKPLDRGRLVQDFVRRFDMMDGMDVIQLMVVSQDKKQGRQIRINKRFRAYTRQQQRQIIEDFADNYDHEKPELVFLFAKCITLYDVVLKATGDADEASLIVVLLKIAAFEKGFIEEDPEWLRKRMERAVAISNELVANHAKTPKTD
jgi:hypothetical protein